MQNLWIVVSSSDTSSDKGDGPTLQLPISSLLVLASAQLEDREESWVDHLGWPFFKRDFRDSTARDKDRRSSSTDKS